MDAAKDGQTKIPLNYQATPRPSSGGWTLAVLCIGLGLVAACVLIPQADANRRMVYEHEKLSRDLQQIHKQIDVNDQFLAKMQSDPQLAERLAQRQMKMIRQGTSVLELKKPDGQAASLSQDMSPFLLVNVPPPPALPPYRPVAGMLSSICLQPRLQLYAMGGGLFLIAAALILGDKPPALPLED